ncbi:hypothetical protein HQQ80_12830 [Microbacteriaceae bacterium VKM Ac-2855]|nr:hypothetical protein [Microbacteriaceae bacterium VKM Ac-2855]
MGKTWTDAAVDYLGDREICPRCDDGPITDGICRACRVDLSAAGGNEVWRLSQEAGALLARRQAQVDALPIVEVAVTMPTEYVPPALPADYAPPALPVPGTEPRVFAPRAPAWTSAPPSPAATGASSRISIQSVLAVVGAALFAVAAIVFTFFNPDLTNFATRSLIVAAITAVFLGGAWLLARLKLQFSAEAVGALGMVFVVLDVSALARAVPIGIDGWAAVGIATLLCSAVMVLIAALARIRSWLWAGLVGVALAPAFLGYSGDMQPASWAGHLGVGFVAVALHSVLERMRRRFDAPLAADRLTLIVLQLLATTVVTGQLLFAALLAIPDARYGAVPSVLALAALALLAAVSTRTGSPRFWSWFAGAYSLAAVSATIALLPADIGDTWVFALAAAASIGIVVLAALPVRAPLARLPLLLGGWVVLLVATLPALSFVLLSAPGYAGVPVAPGLLGLVTSAAGAWLAVSAARRGGADPLTVHAIRNVSNRVVGVTGEPAQLVATPTPVSTDYGRGMRAVALWLLTIASLGFANWWIFLPLTRIAIGLVIAAALALLVTRVRAIAEAPLMLRAIPITAAHLQLIAAAAAVTLVSPLQLAVGVGVLVVLVAVARTVPIRIRSLHVGIGFAYALVVIAVTLTDAGLDVIPVLCLTTSIASAAALGATLIRRVQPGPWYAILIVTAVPFLIGIASVLAVRSGWTALSTGVTFALALTLVLTRRPGLNRLVRSAAAAILVPSLAVVVVCLGAQILLDSASPVTLPVIAAIVAVVLPFTSAMERALVRHGLGAADARAARSWIELSSLVTAALAVLLALVRSAAGFETSFLVLVILGLGASAAGVITRRRDAWVLAAVAWTGALWSLWAMFGVTALEPYVLPPALAAAIVGAVFVLRGMPGRVFYAVGLVIAVVTPLGVLASTGDGSTGDERWRAHALLSAGVALVGLGALLVRRGVNPLVSPTLGAAVLAGSAGAIEGVRMGLRLDEAGVADAQLLLPVLGYAAVATAVAIVAARILVRFADDGARRHGGVAASVVRSRWAYAPAVLLAAVGPITAVRPGPLAFWGLWLVMLALLTLLLVTVARSRIRTVTLPPAWFLFAVTWCVAVAGWSTRESRVEFYALPLGLALLAAGALAARAEGRPASFTSWPIGHTGSWRRLTPGLVVLFLPSMLATGTDPETARAILVIVLALAAILIGSLRRLGAPFVIGILVLPIENAIVFAVQLGRSIGAAPWWITLATAGAVLLVIAVTSERRTRGGTAARLRDLN